MTGGVQAAALGPGSTRCLCRGVLGRGGFAASSPAWGAQAGFCSVQPAAKASAWSHQDKEPRGIIPLENLSIREVEDSKKPVSAAAGSPGAGGPAPVLWLGQEQGRESREVLQPPRDAPGSGGRAPQQSLPPSITAARCRPGAGHHSVQGWWQGMPGGCGVMVTACPSLSAALGIAVPGERLQSRCSASSLPAWGPLWKWGLPLNGLLPPRTASSSTSPTTRTR